MSEIIEKVAEAIGVVILPKDAEPEEGDVIIAYGDYDTLEQRQSGVVSPTTNWDYWNAFQHIKIIQRNDKPVIQED